MSSASQPFRHRHDGWTPVRQQRFLKVLALTGCVRDACRAVGLSSTSAYRAKAKLPAFAAGWELALESVASVLFATAYERAVEGWEEDVWYRGAVVGKRRRYDHHTLRMLIERGNRSERRRPPTEAEKLSAAHAAARAAGGTFGPTPTPEETDRQIGALMRALALKRPKRGAGPGDA